MDVKNLFHPSSIAIVGVSRERRKVGHIVAHNMISQGYKGELYFVNPKAEKILGHHVYPSLSEIKKPIDLVVLALPADLSIVYLDEIHKLGVKNVIIYAAGFKETGEEGKKKEEMLKKKCEEYGITVLGPNCIGFINTADNINTTFLKHTAPKGNIGFISQSGALGSVLVDYFVAHQHLGFSFFISLGNKSIIDESDTLAFLAQDPSTTVIGMYLEDVKDGKKFTEILSKVTRKKPVVILKSGTTEEGSQAAVSHTGGLVGNDDVYTAAFRQAGAIRAADFTEFMTILKIFSYDRVPKNSQVLVLSNAGGAGVLLADELIHHNLSLITISEKTKQSLIKDFGSRKITVHNPIDVLGDASAFDYQQVMEETFKEKALGSVIILLTPQANTEILKTAQTLVSAQANFHKPIFPVFMGEESVEKVHKLFESHKIVGFSTFDHLPRSLEHVAHYRKFLHKEKKWSSQAVQRLSILGYEQEITKILQGGTGKPFLNLLDSMKVLELSGIPMEQIHHVESSSDLPTVVKETGFPVAAKVATDTITHKTEAKGVITDIKSLDELFAAYKMLTDPNGINGSGCYVQKMVSGYEVFVGAKRDPRFGIVVVVGLGGVMAELIKDVANCVYPFDLDTFQEAIKNTRLIKLLQGYRGDRPADVSSLFDIAIKTGHLLSSYDIISELDINPVMVSNGALKAIDGRIVLK